jgi:hypothetical protein
MININKECIKKKIRSFYQYQIIIYKKIILFQINIFIEI